MFEKLKSEGFNVQEISDVDYLFSERKKMLFSASCSVEHRLAAAKAADINNMGGGFCHMLWYSDCNYISFGNLDSGSYINNDQV